MAIIRLDPDALGKVSAKDPRLSTYMSAISSELIIRSRANFLLSQKSFNEWRTSETTPPKYIASFKKIKRRTAIRLGRPRFIWRVLNDDPSGVWVEYGAHAGGKTPVLGYRPMTRALASMAVS